MKIVNHLLAMIFAGVMLLKLTVLPVLDERVSARRLWKQVESSATQVCVGEIHRSWRYGLNYYSITPLPSCVDADHPLHIEQSPGEPARLNQ